jgi:hypothetical protein
LFSLQLVAVMSPSSSTAASPLRLIALLSLLSAFACLSPVSGKCVVLNYDLSPLSTRDLHYSTVNDSYVYRPCKPAFGCPSEANFCRQSLLSHNTSLLSYWPSASSSSPLSSVLHAVDTSAGTDAAGVGAVLRYTQWTGEQCDEGVLGGERRVTVTFVCNPLAEVAVLGVAEVQPCVYDLAVTSRFLCQTTTGRRVGGGGGGGQQQQQQ